jgi:hypothetical protein
MYRLVGRLESLAEGLEIGGVGMPPRMEAEFFWMMSLGNLAIVAAVAISVGEYAGAPIGENFCQHQSKRYSIFFKSLVQLGHATSFLHPT